MDLPPHQPSIFCEQLDRAVFSLKHFMLRGHHLQLDCVAQAIHVDICWQIPMHSEDVVCEEIGHEYEVFGVFG